MNLSAEEFVNDYLVDRNLVGRTRAAKVASLLDAWIRLEFTGPHSRQVESLRRRNADLLAALEALVADERKFISAYQKTVDSYIFICNFCGADSDDERQIQHKPDCEIEQARALLTHG